MIGKLGDRLVCGLKNLQAFSGKLILDSRKPGQLHSADGIEVLTGRGFSTNS